MNPSRSDGISDVALLGAVAIVVAVGALVWLWGGLAGALFGSGWPRVDTGQLLGVLTRLPGRLSDPAGAWPAPARLTASRGGGFYAALGLLAGAWPGWPGGCRAGAPGR